MKSCFLTRSYKQGYIHSYFYDGNEIFQVQVDKFAYLKYVKSIRAAKLLITKHFRGVK